MVIGSFDVKASSQRSFLSVETTTMTTKQEVQPIGSPADSPKNAIETNKGAGGEDVVSLSDSWKKMQEKIKDESEKMLAQQANAMTVRKAKLSPKVPRSPEELKITLLEMMLEHLTGKKAKVRLQNKAGEDQKSYEPDFSSTKMNAPAMTAGNNPAPQVRTVDGWNFETFKYESESISYKAQGYVNTADGRTISFDINMQMSRQYASYSNLFIGIERPCDPLVINYGGSAASLTGEKFDFDLDMDGRMDKVAVLGEGSGFLALDKNGDGKINDGSELFGPQNGNGFAELRKYDRDGNNWIDESDDIFSKLRIWCRDKNGNDQLFTLKELGVGAIYLGDVDTEFSLKNDSNQTLGIMRSTSFFLKENGGGGTVSHIDMMI